jgi:branched-chain amino acid transport system permease protein
MKYSIYAFIALLGFLGLSLMNVNEYIFFAGFVILQFVVLATAWNILAAMQAM